MTDRPAAGGPATGPASGSEGGSTGDAAVDAVLSGLEGTGDLGPAEEIEAYRAALDGLGRLLEEQPRIPGAG